MYKQVKTLTKNIGSAGAQVKVATIGKLDNVGMTGYANNVIISSIVNDYSSSEIPGLIFYASTSDSWSDDNVISARAVTGSASGTVNLPLKRRVSADTQQAENNDGRIYIYAECTDVAVLDDTDIRLSMELWGRFIEFK